MGETTHTSITERQAEARRKNGAKSRGPVTEQGKRISSQNSTRHGGWAIKLRPIDRGPLREDPDEMRLCIDAFVEELDPGDSLALRLLALDAAHDQWKKFRAQRWEAEGYSAPDSAGDASAQADWMRHLAAGDRKAADVIRRLPDPSISVDEMSDALSELGCLVRVSEGVLEDLVDQGLPVMAEALTALIADHFGDPEEAAARLERRADDREDEAALLHAVERPGVIRQEVSGPFTQNLVRLLAHTSREVDRSLKRYYEQKERMQMSQAPPLADSTAGTEQGPDIGTDQDQDVASAQSQRDTDTADAGMDTDQAASGGSKQSETGFSDAAAARTTRPPESLSDLAISSRSFWTRSGGRLHRNQRETNLRGPAEKV